MHIRLLSSTILMLILTACGTSTLVEPPASVTQPTLVSATLAPAAPIALPQTTPGAVAATSVPASGGATPLPAADPPPDSALPGTGVSDGMEEFLRQTSPEELAKRAELIVLGTTVGPQVSGQLSPDSPLALRSESAEYVQVYTETPIQVERTLKGTAPDTTVRVRTLGGNVDGHAMGVTHQPQLRVGQRVVVFLRPIEQGYYAVLGEDGVYEIVEEQAIGPRHQYPLPDLVSRIQSNAP